MTALARALPPEPAFRPARQAVALPDVRSAPEVLAFVNTDAGGPALLDGEPFRLPPKFCITYEPDAALVWAPRRQPLA